MKVLVSAFQCAPGFGGEIGNGWMWSTSLADRGHEVTVLTHAEYRARVLAGARTDIDFHFIEAADIPVRLPGGIERLRHVPPLPEHGVRTRCRPARRPGTSSTTPAGDRCTWAAGSGGCRSRWCTARSAAARPPPPLTGATSGANGRLKGAQRRHRLTAQAESLGQGNAQELGGRPGDELGDGGGLPRTRRQGHQVLPGRRAAAGVDRHRLISGLRGSPSCSG